MKENNFVSAVIYLHDNADTIGEFIRTVNSVLYDNFKKYEVICVDDASCDNGISIVQQIAGELSGPTVSVLRMGYYQGIELSMNAGTDLAIGDFVFEFDNPILDFEQSCIIKGYRRLLDGYDIVSVSPDNMRRNSSKLFYSIFNRYSNTLYKLKTENFRILSRRVINRVQAMSRNIPYRKAVYANSGLKMDTIYYTPLCAQSSLGRKEIAMRKGVAADSLILFTDFAYRITIGLAVMMMAFTVVVAIYALVYFFGGGMPVSGWTFTILFLSASFFGIFIILAVIIKYISVLINLIFRRQKYSVESIEKIMVSAEESP